MAAKIEICWGKNVQERMEQLLHLKSVPLWGRYQGATIHFDMDDGHDIPRINRILIFVCHPQSFFRIGSRNDFAVNFRKTVGRNQDLLLQVAAKLGEINIPRQFYEVSYVPCHGPGKLKLGHLSQVKGLEKEARNQLRIAVPDKFEKLETTTRDLEAECFAVSASLPPSPALTEAGEIDEVRAPLAPIMHILDSTNCYCYHQEQRRTLVKQEIISSFRRATSELILEGSKAELVSHGNTLQAILKPECWDGI